jgi:hypothetical protein
MTLATTPIPQQASGGQAGAAVTLYVCIPEVLGSNLDRDTGYLDRVSVILLSISWQMRGIPPRFFPSHHS